MGKHLTFLCTVIAEKQTRKFLEACINPDQWEANPILQDYMTPETVQVIDKLIEQFMTAKERKEQKKKMLRLIDDLEGPYRRCKRYAVAIRPNEKPEIRRSVRSTG